MDRTRPTEDQVRKMYLDYMMTTQQIAEASGYSSQTVQKWLKRYRIPARRTGPLSGCLHPSWKGGLTYDKSGYILRYSPNHPDANIAGYVREHRLVMEKKLGRSLLPTEVVHHKDADPSNNHPDNLELFETNATHLSATLKGKCPNWTAAGRQRILDSVRSRSQVWPEDLLEQYKTKSSQQIADELGCTIGCVLDRLRSLGATIRAQHRPRTIVLPENLLELHQQFPSTRQLAAHLGVSRTLVRDRLDELGAPTDALNVAFPPKAELEKLHETHSTKQLAAQFGCTASCVVRHLNRLGIPVHPKGWPHSKPLPPDDRLQQLLDSTDNVAELARSLGVSKYAIYHWMKKRGIAAHTKAALASSMRRQC